MTVNSSRADIISKALKLRELSIRGVDGEKENATRMYSVYVEKHGITEAELSASSESFKWRPSSKAETSDLFSVVIEELERLGVKDARRMAGAVVFGLLLAALFAGVAERGYNTRKK